MKLHFKFFLFIGILFCVNQNIKAQDNFSRFNNRLNEAMQKKTQPTSSEKLKKNKNIRGVSKGYTVDYSPAFLENPSFPFDTIPRRRQYNCKLKILEDSLIKISNSSDTNKLVINDSIPKKKKKKKNEEFFLKSDSTQTDSLIKQEFVIEDTMITFIDTLQIQQQVIYMDSAYGFLIDNKFSEALYYYNLVAEQFPESDEYKYALLWRGKAKAGLNDLEGAKSDLNAFIERDSCNSKWCTESYYQRGLVNFKLHNYLNANEDFTRVLLDSDYVNLKYCFFYRAFCWGEAGNYIFAVQDYTKFLNLDKFKSVSSAEALYYRGFYKVKLDDNRGAISDYELAIEMYSGAYESSKNKNQIYFQKLIDTYITRGLAYAEIKKWDDAIGNYNTVIKMKPDYATAFHLKGLSEIGKGDLDAGCLDLSKAGELGSTDAYNDIKIHCK